MSPIKLGSNPCMHIKKNTLGNSKEIEDIPIYMFQQAMYSKLFQELQHFIHLAKIIKNIFSI
jgi:hypothetical protein